MKRKPGTILLHRETLHQLDAAVIAKVAGGTPISFTTGCAPTHCISFTFADPCSQ